MAKPDKLNIIWGSSGTSVDPGDAKFELGWVAEIPPYQYFNYVLNKHSAALDNLNTYGTLEWDALTSYVKGSVVMYNGIEYKCRATTSIGSIPSDIGSDWISADFTNPIISNGDDFEGATIHTDLGFYVPNIGDKVRYSGNIQKNGTFDVVGSGIMSRITTNVLRFEGCLIFTGATELRPTQPSYFHIDVPNNSDIPGYNWCVVI